MEQGVKDGGDPPGGRDTMYRLERHKLSSAVFIVIAVMLQVSVIIMEDEPTALAPFLVLLGVTWHVATRIRIRRLRESMS
jgi:hypothetical protein